MTNKGVSLFTSFILRLVISSPHFPLSAEIFHLARLCANALVHYAALTLSGLSLM